MRVGGDEMQTNWVPSRAAKFSSFLFGPRASDYANQIRTRDLQGAARALCLFCRGILKSVEKNKVEGRCFFFVLGKICAMAIYCA